MKSKDRLIFHKIIKNEQAEPVCSEKYCFVVPLAGRVNVMQKREISEMVPEDILLIQPLTWYALSTVHGVCLLYEADFARLDADLIDELNGVVCDSSAEKGKARYQRLIYYILQSLEAAESRSAFITERRRLLQILEELLNKCTMGTGCADDMQTEEQEVLDYIRHHYKEPLSLSSLSAHFYISKSALSKMFKERVGSSFLEYLSEIRMMHAVGYLQDPKKTIEHIAEENGFANARSFSGKFQEYYHMLPSEYRRKHGNDRQESLSDEDSRYLFTFQKQIQGQLRDRAQVELPLKKQMIEDVCPERAVSVKSPDIILSVNRSGSLLIYQNHNLIREIVHELGFRYIYLHELFHADMEICVVDRAGKVNLSFYKLDQLFDAVVECKLIPFVELSFLPRWMSDLDEPGIVRLESVAEMPRDMEQWKMLVENVVRHLMARYGTKTVLQWKFCIWNSPDNPDRIPMVSQPENYQKLYRETRQVIKQIHPSLQVGLPALMCYSLLHPKWMDAFMCFCRENACAPDFSLVNIFPVEETDEQPKAFQMRPVMRRPDAIRSILQNIRRNNEKFHWHIPKFYIAEWNYDFFMNSRLPETMFLPCYIVKNMVDCWSENMSFGILDPIGSSWQLSQQAYRIGRQVLVTGDNIKMPSWHAYKMLHRMGDRLIRKGDNFMITRTEHEVQILLYNYHHLSEEYCMRKLDYTKWQPEFWESFHELEYEIQLKHLGQKSIRKETYILSEDHGNVCKFCERYLRTDEEKVTDPEVISYINGKNRPLRMVEKIYPKKDGSLCIYETLQPQEVRLICLSEV